MRWTLVFAAVSGLVAVAVGAWTAHGAAAVLDPQAVEWMRTAAQYQTWHTLALVGVSVLMGVKPGRFLFPATLAFAAGIVLFSGSLYGLALTHLRAFAFVTPIGGIGFLAGWFFLAIYALSLDRR
jgi:uncharacterized membrane protein YgdD (TMEM256/DUF423 family)